MIIISILLMHSDPVYERLSNYKFFLLDNLNAVYTNAKCGNIIG